MKRLFRFMLLLNLAVLPACAFAQTTGRPVTQQALPDDGVSRSPLAKCLPADIKLSDVVETINGGSRKITVEEKLNALKATCHIDNKLVDGNGKQIIFYHLIGCWGNPPPNYQEILQKQRDEINKLKQQYTVIAMTCNPSGIPIP